MEEKYGKPYDKDMFRIKQGLYDENDRFLKNALRIIHIYSGQPFRTHCKLCGKKLSLKKCFSSQGIDYAYCEHCHHLNGFHEETVDFCSKVIENSGAVYKEPDADAFEKRLKTIYLPKMDFLLEHLQSDRKMENFDIKILDVGAGSGYFVGAGLQRNVDIIGVEASAEQVELGNRMLQAKVLQQVDILDVKQCVAETSCNVVTFIGVLEHLDDLRAMLQTIQKNDNIQYIFFSVPLFSFSCVFAAVFPNVYNRQFGGGHTHLFSLDSIHYMNEEYGFEPVSTWQFGTDAMDMYRSIMVTLGNENSQLRDIFSEHFLPCSDMIQLLFDKSGFSSEIHMLVRKKKSEALV